MMAARVTAVTSRIATSGVLQRLAGRRLATSSKPVTTEDEDDDLSKPIQYTTSPAVNWKARHSFAGADHDKTPWYEPYIVMASTGGFIIYFLYLREANDIDQIFDRELGDYFSQADAEAFKRKLDHEMKKTID